MATPLCCFLVGLLLPAACTGLIPIAPAAGSLSPHHSQIHGSSCRGGGSATALYLDGKGMAGGTQHLLGDVLRSLQPRYLNRVAESIAGTVRGPASIDPSNIDALLSCDVAAAAPSWDELSSALAKAQTPRERRFRSDLEPSALASRRLFGSPEPRVVLYRDSAAWCPYCQKVWIALEERRVPYEVRRVDMRCFGTGKPDEFLRLQPSGNLPCAIVDGRVVGESDEIVDAIDEIGDEGTPRLRPPPGSPGADRLVELCDDGRSSLERRLYSRWMWWLTGIRRPEEYRELYEEHLDEVERALAEAPGGGPFFLGSDVSLADVRFAPFVERQVASLAYFKGYDGRDPARRPNLARWLDAMEARPAYRATKSDYYTHSRALPPQLSAGCASEVGCEDTRDLIDDLPFAPAAAAAAEETANGGVAVVWLEPGWDWCADPAVARREAPERLIHNHEDIVQFASRAAGTPGLPASSAPLADPRAAPSDDVAPAVDLFLRYTARALLTPVPKRGGGAATTAKKKNDADVTSAISVLASGPAGPAAAVAVADCLDYLRARVGVPRDMSHPAAQQLRAELKLLSGRLRAADVGTGEGATVETARATIA